MGTPGALDNAGGIVVLLGVGALLATYNGRVAVELVAMNGEDYFSNPGERRFLDQHEEHMQDIELGINIDGVGYFEGRTAYSLYGCDPHLAATIHDVCSTDRGWIEGQDWLQGDHALFIMHQRPALAVTSERVIELLRTVIHTPQDRFELVDPLRLANASRMLVDLIQRLGAGD
jgi:aminopeptidase YwaD